MRARPKLAPGPFNTPSLKKEFGGVDPDLQLVPEGGPVWGGNKTQRDLETTASAAARANASNERMRAEQALEMADTFRSRETAARQAAQELAARAALAKERALLAEQEVEEDEEEPEEEEEEQQQQQEEEEEEEWDLQLTSEIERIKAELQLDPDTPLADAVEQANSTMGLEAQGSLVEQVAALLEAMGLEIAYGNDGNDEWEGSEQIRFPSQPSLAQIQREQEEAANAPLSPLLPPPPAQFRMLVRASHNTASAEADAAPAPAMPPSGVTFRQADKSIEEREAEYAAARARIMGTSTPRAEESGAKAKAMAGGQLRQGRSRAEDSKSKHSPGSAKPVASVQRECASDLDEDEPKRRGKARNAKPSFASEIERAMESATSPALTPEQQRQQLGAQLYARVCAVMDMSTALSGKVTGMILDMPHESILPLLQSYRELRATILQALTALSNAAGGPLAESVAHMNGSFEAGVAPAQPADGPGAGKGSKAKNKQSCGKGGGRRDGGGGTGGGGTGGGKQGGKEEASSGAGSGSSRGERRAASDAAGGGVYDGRSEC